jgi:hypothetical protein
VRHENGMQTNAGGKIHEIEALGFMAPYESKTGWE